MITGINLHCDAHPVMVVKQGENFCWLELNTGTPRDNIPISRIAIHSRCQSREALQKAVDGFNAAFAQVVAIVEDETAAEFMEAAE